MSERLPSVRVLSLMSDQDRHWTLQRIADDTREERGHILSGYYIPWDGHTRRAVLEMNRRKLARVYARAAEFGHDVSQPKRAAGSSAQATP